MKHTVTKTVTGAFVVRFPCPKCGGMLNEKLNRAGQPDQCPSCATRLEIPGTKELAEQQALVREAKERKAEEQRAKAEQQRAKAEEKARAAAEYERQQADAEAERIELAARQVRQWEERKPTPPVDTTQISYGRMIAIQAIWVIAMLIFLFNALEVATLSVSGRDLSAIQVAQVATQKAVYVIAFYGVARGLDRMVTVAGTYRR